MKIIIYGNPVAQGRPKFSTHNGYVRAYDPQKSRDWKSYAKFCAAEEMKGKPLLTCPLRVVVMSYREIPKSLSKKKALQAQNGLIRPSTKPDIDNYIKGAFDAIEGIVYKNDSQIVSLCSEKYYSTEPRLEIHITEDSTGAIPCMGEI